MRRVERAEDRKNTERIFAMAVGGMTNNFFAPKNAGHELIQSKANRLCLTMKKKVKRRRTTTTTRSTTKRMC